MTEENEVEESDEFNKFDTTVKTLTGVLTIHKQELGKARKVGRIGVGVGILGLLLAGLGVFVAFDGRSLAQNIQSVRTEARISSCIRDNVAIVGNRDALVSSILVFAQDPANLTPREQEIADAYRAKVEQAQPYRDCSPAGLDKYYEDPPSDPAKF